MNQIFKSLSIITLSLSLSSCGIIEYLLTPSEQTSSNNSPAKPSYIRIDNSNFEIYDKYLSYKKNSPLNESYDQFLMDWEKAKTLCQELGNGWRLPTNKELIIMGNNLEVWGGEATSLWGTDLGKHTAAAFTSNGPESYGAGGLSPKSEFHVRPVRTIN